jgi:excisionase family DNA binding protein
MGNNGNEAMSDHWLSLAEIASYLGVSKDSVYRWVETRDLPAQNVDRQWKFKVDEVDAWVRSGQADFMAGATAKRQSQTLPTSRAFRIWV